MLHNKRLLEGSICFVALVFHTSLHLKFQLITANEWISLQKLFQLLFFVILTVNFEFKFSRGARNAPTKSGVCHVNTTTKKHSNFNQPRKWRGAKSH